MTPVVVVLVVVLALGALAGLVFFTVSRLVRHWSRTREQANVVFAVQMELMALVHATVQRCDAANPANGNGNGLGQSGFDPQTAQNQAQARASLGKNLPLLKDPHLRQITRDVLERTSRLPANLQAADASRISDEIRRLQASFQLRSNEVVRDMRLGRA